MAPCQAALNKIGCLVYCKAAENGLPEIVERINEVGIL